MVEFAFSPPMPILRAHLLLYFSFSFYLGGNQGGKKEEKKEGRKDGREGGSKRRETEGGNESMGGGKHARVELKVTH